jgi:hypothetical protein
MCARLQDPTCAKVTLVGRAVPVPAGPQRDAALRALYARHPQMQDWPTGHHFQPYELHVEEAHLLDWCADGACVHGWAACQ